MIVDSSALIAILKDEPEAVEFTELILSGTSRISAANWLEAAMVADGSPNPDSGTHFDAIVESAGLVIEPVTDRQVRSARHAFRRYGKGSGSKARLDFGDCLAYALAATSGEPLLFKGDDFGHTDIVPARRAG